MAKTVKGIKVNGSICDFTFNEVSGNTKFNLVSPNNTTFQVMVDDNGGVYGYNSNVTGETGTTATTINVTSPDGTVYELRVDNEGNIYGYNESVSPIEAPVSGVTSTDKFANNISSSDSCKLYINSFYCGGTDSDEHSFNYCSHNFVELSNLTGRDINLSGMSIQYSSKGAWTECLPLKGVIKNGSTFLIRGEQCSVINSNKTKINVSDYDMEWRNSTGELVRFSSDCAKFYLVFTQNLITSTSNPFVISGTSVLIPSEYIDMVGVNGKTTNTDAFEKAAAKTYSSTLSNCLYKKYYAMDSVSQATKALKKRSNSGDWNYVDLTKNDGEFVSNIADYTPKASKDNKNIYYNKTKLTEGKPSIINCSFGIEATDNGNGATRCFNWVSKGIYDEYIWIKKHSDTSWGTPNESYKSETGLSANYNRITVEYNDGVAFTSHKFIKRGLETGVYDYVAGHKNSDNTPNLELCTDVRSFTVRTKDEVSGETIFVQTSDQQGFNSDEYRLWNTACKTIISEDRDADFTSYGSGLSTYVTKDNAGKIIYVSKISYGYTVNEVYTYTDTKPEGTFDTFEVGKYSINGLNNITKLGTNGVGIQFMVNTGDMTQNGNRMGEWLDYFNAKTDDMNNLEEVSTVGNNDLSPKYTYQLGTGSDDSKISLSNYNYFYCNEIDENNPPVFEVEGNDYYIPSLYSFNYGVSHFLCLNSEIKASSEASSSVEPVYDFSNSGNFYPLIRKWCEKDIENNSGYTWNIAYCHEMPFTIITSAATDGDSVNGDQYMKNLEVYETNGKGREGSNANLNIDKDSRYWFSEFCQNNGIKLVIGGHKHTQSTSYPLLENVSYEEASTSDSGVTRFYKETGDNTGKYIAVDDTSDTTITYYKRKVRSWRPIIVIPTDSTLWSESKSYYTKDGDTYTKVEGITRKDLYNGTKYYTDEEGTEFNDTIFSEFVAKFSSSTYIATDSDFNGKYYPDKLSVKDKYLCEFLLDFEVTDDVNPVIYAMSQATGYKHTSNKEMPSWDIPWLSNYYPTSSSAISDANVGQKFPFYTIWSITPDKIEGNVRKVYGAFDGNGKFDINKDGQYLLKGLSTINNDHSNIIHSVNGLDEKSTNTFNTIIIK